MARIRSDYTFGTLGTGISASDTTISSTGLSRLPVVSGSDVAALTLHDPNTGAYEIVWVTAHTASATTATVLRGQEGTTAAIWPADTAWLNGITVAGDVADFLASSGGGETDWVYEPYLQSGFETERETLVGTWGVFPSSSHLTGGIRFNNSTAQNDSFGMAVWLGPGNYTLIVVANSDPTRAIQTWEIDNGSGVYQTIGTMDYYAASNANNVKKTLTFSLSNPLARRTLRAKAATRNASATGWYMALSRITILRTS